MSNIAVQGGATGTGTVTLLAPITNTDRTLTLPDATTTVVGTDATQTLTNKSIAVTQLTGTLPVANGGTGAATLTANNVLLGNGTSAVQFVAPSTNGNVLTSNGTTWTSAAAGGGFPSGTAMLFAQTAAPTGFTKSTTHNDKALRVVSGAASSGGTTAFTTVFANQTPTITTSGLSAGATTLSTAQIPSHSHSGGFSPSSSAGGCPCGNPVYRGTNVNTGNAGGGGSHTHTVTGTATSTAITLAVQYVDVIIATKD